MILSEAEPPTPCPRPGSSAIDSTQPRSDVVLVVFDNLGVPSQQEAMTGRHFAVQPSWANAASWETETVRLVLTLLGYVLFFFLFVGLLLAYGWLFGPRISDEAFVILVLASLLVGVALWFRDRRRGKPPDVTGPDPGQLLRAPLFFLALGGFGLLLTAYAVWRYPDFDRLGVGVGAACCGYMTVIGLLGIRRVRRETRD